MRIAVIGAGFSGLSTACYLANEGHEVTIFEKNEQVGGRARQWKRDGFTFDMGPSWYWMPRVFSRFFADFGKDINDLLDLKQLDPGFRVIFSDEVMDIPADVNQIGDLFEKVEPGSKHQLQRFIDDSGKKYNASMEEIVYLPSHSIGEYIRWDIMRESVKLDLVKPFNKYVNKYFKNPRLKTIMEFPVLFLGAKPSQIPAMYSLMNYSALVEGTWYPMGGMFEVISAMADLAHSLGVTIKTDAIVSGIVSKGNRVTYLEVGDDTFQCDAVVASADYHHVDRDLLQESRSNYSEKYWDKRVMAPSCLLFYVGVDKRVDHLEHHNLFFDTPFDKHAELIYDRPGWPEEPQFYVCVPSKTDPSVAPDGKENLFILIPIAPGIEDTEEQRARYFDLVIDRIEKKIGVTFQDDILFNRSYCINDFVADYNAYKGNAYGLANTLLQTGPLKPKMKNRKLKNLIYTGQLTVPGPGVPPSIISGKIAANEIVKNGNEKALIQ